MDPARGSAPDPVIGRSTETAIVRVLSGILQAVDRDNLAAVVLLDLSAAFNTVDRTILLRCLQQMFGIDDTADRWFESYLSFRKQYVRHDPNKSSASYVVCGVLGPILFVLYTADLLSVIDSHGLSAHRYADDTQVYGACRPHSRQTYLSVLKQQLPG